MLSSAELTELWQEHSAALLLMARCYCRQIASSVAEDCVQEAFVRLAAQKVVPDSPAAWLVTAVRNAMIDAVRSQKRRRQREQLVAHKDTHDASHADVVSETCSSDELQVALQQLDDMTRDILVAHLWNQMTFRQIADIFGLSRSTAHRRYEDGIRQLRSLLSEISSTSTNVASVK